jgi:hypothetical protein
MLEINKKRAMEGAWHEVTEANILLLVRRIETNVAVLEIEKSVILGRMAANKGCHGYVA